MHFENGLEQDEQLVHLRDIEKREELANVEQLHFEVPLAVPNGIVEGSDDRLVEPDLVVVAQMERDLHRVVLDADEEELLDPLGRVRDLLDESGELLQVVDLAVHLEHLVDVVRALQEALVEEEPRARLHLVVLDDDLLVVRAVVGFVGA